MFTSTALASGFSLMARSTSLRLMPRDMPSIGSMLGLTYTGTAPQRIRALMALLWTFRGIIILSPRLHAVMTIACTAEVVPPTMKKAWAAPKASAASSSASLMTETGWHRLSSIFMEFTSTERHLSPKKSVSSLLPRPLLCPGTSKGTNLALFIFSRASSIGALSCVTYFIPDIPPACVP